MPAAPSGSRRSSRKQSGDEEDIQSRRARGEISCKECRRLKLKCDKRLPCGSCVRRGCPSICPNGSLASGQGTRFVLADTSQLHAKISQMGSRIRQLEDALAIFQSGVSNETHTLLRDDLLAIKFGPEISNVEPEESPQSLSNPIDALGTLTIGAKGEAKYFGRSAGSETLFLAGAEFDDHLPEMEEASILPEISRLSGGFPFYFGADPNEAMPILYDCLPDQLRGWSLCETYYEHAAATNRPISRDELVNDILVPVYKTVKEKENNEFNGTYPISSHKLGVLFMVFCHGALMDLTLPAYNSESERYYHTGRACMGLRSVFDSPEMATVQALCLMANYHSMGGRRYTVDSTWAVMSLGAKLAQSLGLHRESSRWNMDAKTIQRRRQLFYEVFCNDMFHSLALGRPPSIRLSYVDCEYPTDQDGVQLDENGKPRITFYQWKYDFCRNILSTIVEMTLGAQPPSYQTILDLDRKVREMTLPAYLNMFATSNNETCTPSTYIRGCILAQYRSVALLYIHRSFFAQAMLDHPANPLRSPYSPSFLAAYRCASGVIKASLNHFDRFPELCCRWWGLWTHLFSAAIIVGCIVTRSPSSTMASNAFIELGLACDLFEKASVHSRRARSGLGILRRLRESAFQVYSQFRSGNSVPPPTFASVGRDYGEDELALFGGQTRVVFSKLFSKLGMASSPSTQSNSPTPSIKTPDSSDHPSPPDPLPEVHPSLVEYLHQLPASQQLQSSSCKFPTEPNLQNDITPSNFHPHIYQGNSELSPFAAPSNNFVPDFGNSNSNSHSNDLTELFGNTVPLFPNEFSAIYDEPVSVEAFTDIRMLSSGDSGMDEQWRVFLRDTGILDQNRAS